ncbi:ABC transporter related protein [Solidesulfovibrio fructosivorans JJ]]|uniref:ABC transporter related protein n=1 Tax=Solidesulfovibrio fructosivorans JJ] TaxID=596151 RepID=E1JTH2_SOLFR|nr:ATP-binding cassette domain-containing protein [Solidesulfovibrio fructosivorans]EFL52432.1 ABC transporter related protein [Solidesulfovibrio fructosivorans JJ]]
MIPVLVFSEVGKHYRGREVLSGLDLTLEPGEILAILGPSGIGKSTLLRLAAGLDRPNRGTVTLAARRLGFVFQEPRLLPWRTALENVALPLLAQGIPPRSARERAAAMLARLELAAFAGAYPDMLSGGMRQRVSLARAFVVEPELLLLDEPFTGLDPELRRAIRRTLETLLAASGAAALHVTHDIEDIPAATRRILRLTAAGPCFEFPQARDIPAWKGAV